MRESKKYLGCDFVSHERSAKRQALAVRNAKSWTFCLLGAPLVGMAGVFQANHERDRAAFWAIGGSTLGLGILSFVLANTLTKTPATLNLKVSGQVVQKKPILSLPQPTPTEVPANPPADSPAP